jgi:hypothetical protein
MPLDPVAVRAGSQASLSAALLVFILVAPKHACESAELDRWVVVADRIFTSKAAVQTPY